MKPENELPYTREEIEAFRTRLLGGERTLSIAESEGVDYTTWLRRLNRCGVKIAHTLVPILSVLGQQTTSRNRESEVTTR